MFQIRDVWGNLGSFSYSYFGIFAYKNPEGFLSVVVLVIGWWRKMVSKVNLSCRAAFFIAPLLVSGAVYAQDAADLSGCQSVVGSYCVPAGASASLQNVSGAVSILRNTSVIDGSSGASLVSGDRVVTQEGSSLLVLGPTCKISVGNFSSASLSTSGTSTCLTLGSSTQTTTNDTTSGTMLAGAAAVGAGALAAGLMNTSSGSD